MGKKRKIGRPPKLIESISAKIETDWIIGEDSGTRLPAQEKLASQYKVDRTTIRSVLDYLETKKSIHRKYGSGAFVGKGKVVSQSKVNSYAIGLSLAKPHGLAGNTYMSSILAGIMKGLNGSGLNLLVSVDRKKGKKYFEQGWDRNIDVCGVVVVDQHSESEMENFSKLKKPVVAVDFDASVKGIDSFCFDNFGAGCLLARRLTKLGHRRVIALAEDPKSVIKDSAWRARQDGFIETWNKSNRFHCELIPVVRNKTGNSNAENQIKKILRREPNLRPTAVFTPTSGWYSSLTNLVSGAELRIPGELTIVGCRQPYRAKEMTGVQLDGQVLAEKAVAFLLRRIRSRSSNLPTRGSKKLIKGVYVAGISHAKIPKS